MTSAPLISSFTFSDCSETLLAEGRVGEVFVGSCIITLYSLSGRGRTVGIEYSDMGSAYEAFLGCKAGFTTKRRFFNNKAM